MSKYLPKDIHSIRPIILFFQVIICCPPRGRQISNWSLQLAFPFPIALFQRSVTLQSVPIAG